MRNALLALSLMAACSMLARSSGAALIDVGLGGTTATGAAVVGSAGDKWNNFSSNQTATPLVDSSGNATTATLTIIADGYGGTFANTSPNTSLTQNYGWTTASPISVKLGGLTPNANYNLYLYNVPDPCCDNIRPGAVAIAASNGGATDSSTGDTTLSTWVHGSNYLQVSATADSTGGISFTYNHTGNAGESDLNGFQIQSASIPEPASLALLGAGAVGLLIRRRRALA